MPKLKPLELGFSLREFLARPKQKVNEGYSLKDGSRRYEAKAYVDQYPWRLGTFETLARCKIAVKLFKYWVAAGNAPENIPRQPKTKDAI